MGWWKVQGTDVTLGDIPLDILGDGVRRIAAEYQREWNRLPTQREWETMLRGAFGSELDPEGETFCEEGVPTAVDLVFSRGSG